MWGGRRWGLTSADRVVIFYLVGNQRLQHLWCWINSSLNVFKHGSYFRFLLGPVELQFLGLVFQKMGLKAAVFQKFLFAFGALELQWWGWGFGGSTEILAKHGLELQAGISKKGRGGGSGGVLLIVAYSAIGFPNFIEAPCCLSSVLLILRTLL